MTKRSERISLIDAAAELEVTAETLSRWEREQRIPKMKRYPNPNGGRPQPMLTRERINHIRELLLRYGPHLSDYRVGYGHLPVGK
jgi:hypothetical protein